MKSLILCSWLCAVSIPSMAAVQSLPADDHQALAWIDQRIDFLSSQSRDRSTPERAIQSYFHFFNAKEEMECLRQEVDRRTTPGQGITTNTVDSKIDAARDRFFDGVPLRYFHQWDDLSFAKCMAERESYAYEIVGVEPIGTDRTKLTISAKNTTPIPAGAKPDDDDMQRRRDGFLFKFDLSKSEQGWKITQIEEKGFLSEGWEAKFTPDDLDPLVPTFIWFDTL